LLHEKFAIDESEIDRAQGRAPWARAASQRLRQGHW
jgi:hypothetical protein